MAPSLHQRGKRVSSDDEALAELADAREDLGWHGLAHAFDDVSVLTAIKEPGPAIKKRIHKLKNTGAPPVSRRAKVSLAKLDIIGSERKPSNRNHPVKVKDERREVVPDLEDSDDSDLQIVGFGPGHPAPDINPDVDNTPGSRRSIEPTLAPVKTESESVSATPAPPPHEPSPAPASASADTSSRLSTAELIALQKAKIKVKKEIVKDYESLIRLGTGRGLC